MGDEKDSTSDTDESEEDEKETTVSDDVPPEDVIEEAERLTRQAREVVDDSEARAYREARTALLANHEYTARLREEDDVLVLYPDEWVKNGTVQPERIDDLDRGIERSLTGGGEADNWEVVFEHNQKLADTVESEHGPVHGANAQALAECLSNHYAKRIEDATEAELREFLEEYYLRNAWPTDDQKAVVRESIQFVFESAGEPAPLE